MSVRAVVLCVLCVVLCACSSPSGADRSGARASGALAQTPPVASGLVAPGVPPSVGPPATPPVGQLPPSDEPELQPPFDSSPFDAFFQAKALAAGAPGMSVALVKGGRVRWARGYGYANLQTRQPATADTLFVLASVSKTLTATALLQLVLEPGRGLTLDSDISVGLGYLARNPHFPQVPITFRMLLTHTTSILDLDASLATVAGDYTQPLGPFVASQLANPQGWHTTAPGTQLEYSNTGFAIAGHLVEQLSGVDLETYMQQRVFAPIGMTETSWFSGRLSPARMAMPYQFEQNGFVPQGFYSWPTYPAGHLITSALQLGRYLAAITRGGELFGRRILPLGVVDEMMRAQIPAIDPNQGLCWFARAGYDGRLLMGHDGAFYGIATDMWFDPATGAGFVLLTNGSAYYNAHTLSTTGEMAVPSHGAAMAEISAKLLEIATTLP